MPLPLKSRVTRPKEMTGKNISLLLGNIEQPVAASFSASDEGEQQPRFEADLMTPERFAVRIGYGIAPFFSEEGEKSGLIVTFQDLTDIRSMEESVRRKDRLAAVGRVAAGLAHEIRNPLGAMRGAIQVLESSVPKESTQASLMDIILRESDRLNKIITNFLTYARPRAGNFSEIDVCEAVGETVTLLRHSPDVKDVHKISTGSARKADYYFRRFDTAQTDFLESGAKCSERNAERRRSDDSMRKHFAQSHPNYIYRYGLRNVRQTGRTIIRAFFRINDRRHRSRTFHRLSDRPRSWRNDQCQKSGKRRNDHRSRTSVRFSCRSIEDKEQALID